jgi:hypothetical protein
MLYTDEYVFRSAKSQSFEAFQRAVFSAGSGMSSIGRQGLRGRFENRVAGISPWAGL